MPPAQRSSRTPPSRISKPSPAKRLRPRRGRRQAELFEGPRDLDRGLAVRSAREVNQASGLLALSVLMDSAVEHYRGSFKNKAMITPLVTSALTLAVSAHGRADPRRGRHTVRNGVFALSALVGVAGTGFHLYNVLKRPNGLAWQNLFYGAPIGAPAALVLAGALGVYSESVREQDEGAPRVFGLPVGRGLAALTSLGLLGTSVEAALLHFRGAFHNRAMYAPVTLPPVGSALLAAAALGRPGRDLWLTRLWMKGLVLLGFAGVAFHAYGVSRAMGGWGNAGQNVVDGPPLPAPPSFSALALAGLAALGMIREHPDA